MTEPREMIEGVRSAAAVTVEHGGIDLTQWEEEFLESVEDQMSNGKSLTTKQRAVLERMWDRT